MRRNRLLFCSKLSMVFHSALRVHALALCLSSSICQETGFHSVSLRYSFCGSVCICLTLLLNALLHFVQSRHSQILTGIRAMVIELTQGVCSICLTPNLTFCISHSMSPCYSVPNVSRWMPAGAILGSICS